MVSRMAIINMGYAINTDKYRESLSHQSATGFVATNRPEEYGEPYNADEKVTGVYVMGTQTINKLSVLGE
jgi:hypothetical protein